MIKEVVIKNQIEIKLFMKELSKTSCDLDFSKNEIKFRRVYFCNITSNPCLYYFSRHLLINLKDIFKVVCKNGRADIYFIYNGEVCLMRGLEL